MLNVSRGQWIIQHGSAAASRALPIFCEKIMTTTNPKLNVFSRHGQQNRTNKNKYLLSFWCNFLSDQISSNEFFLHDLINFSFTMSVRGCYQGVIGSKATDTRLREIQEGFSYLTRESDIKKGKFVLSWLSKDGSIKHSTVLCVQCFHAKFVFKCNHNLFVVCR